MNKKVKLNTDKEQFLNPDNLHDEPRSVNNNNYNNGSLRVNEDESAFDEIINTTFSNTGAGGHRSISRVSVHASGTGTGTGTGRPKPIKYINNNNNNINNYNDSLSVNFPNGSLNGVGGGVDTRIPSISVLARHEQHGQIIQKLRSESKVKWKILLCFLFVKSAAIVNLLAVSSLEETLCDDLNLSSVEFGLITSIVFITAAFTSLLVPRITEKLNVYKSSVIAQTLLTIGQIIFVLGLWLRNDISNTAVLGIIYGSRVIFGIGFALVQVCTYTVVSIWFGQSKYNSLAIEMVSMTVELGILLARYATCPIYNETKSYILAFSIGIIWAIISIITTFISNILENNFNSWLKEYFSKQSFDFLKRLSVTKDNKPDVEVILESKFKSSVCKINLKIWLIMILIIFGWSNIETYSSQMTEPLIKKYNISENYADDMLSASTFVAFIIAPLVGWIASKCGRITLDVYMVLTQITMFGSCALYYWSDCQFFTNTIGIKPVTVGWISVFVFFIGLQTFYGGVFPMLFVECPAYLVGIANSLNAFMYLLFASGEIVLFGYFKSITNNWYASVMYLIGGTSIIGFIISIILLFIKCIEKRRDKINKERFKTMDGKEFASLEDDDEDD